jgi:hypothetical protein
LALAINTTLHWSYQNHPLMQAQPKRRSLLLLVFCFFLAISVKAQTQLQLILHTSKKIDSAVIVHWTDREVAQLPFNDTLQVNFKTRGIDFYHLNYTIANDKNYFVPLVLDTGKIKIVTHIENEKLIIDSVIGSPMYQNYARWKSGFNKLRSNGDTAVLDSFLLKTYEENIDNLFSFQIGSRYVDVHQNDKLKLYALLPLIAKQTKETKDEFGFLSMNKRLLGIIGSEIVLLSEYPLIDRSNQISHGKYSKAKFVILDFWFVGCLPCMEDHQKIVKLLPGLKQKQVELISISNDDSYTKWNNYLVKNNFKWQHYKINGAEENIISRLGIEAYPTYILIDSKGKIMYIASSLGAMLNQLN